MATNSTELALTVIDAQQDMTIKFVIFGFVIFYAFLFYYINSRMNVDTFVKSVYYLISNIYIIITMFLLPLFTIMLFREYEAIQLYTLLVQMYASLFSILFVLVTILGWQKVFDLLGIDFNIGLAKTERTRKGER